MATTASVVPAEYLTSSSLRLLSWNVDGLNTPIKRKKILTHLKRSKPDIIFLQETHWKTNSGAALRAHWLDSCYSATYTSKSRGVAILFKKGLTYTIDEELVDEGGRYLLLKVRISDTAYTLLNVYAPNDQSSDFFANLTNLLVQRGDTNLIMGGDFNTTLCPLLDKSSYHHTASQASRDLLHLIDLLALW